MKQIEQKKISCDLCIDGFIDIVEIDDEEGDYTCYLERCPLCEGKGYLNIIKIIERKQNEKI